MQVAVKFMGMFVCSTSLAEDSSLANDDMIDMHGPVVSCCGEEW